MVTTNKMADMVNMVTDDRFLLETQNFFFFCLQENMEKKKEKKKSWMVKYANKVLTLTCWKNGCGNIYIYIYIYKIEKLYRNNIENI